MGISEGFANWRWQGWFGRAAVWVTLLLLIVLAFSVARLTWTLIHPQPLAGGPPPAMSAPELRAGNGLAAPPVALDAVATLHLFGQTSPGERPVLDEIDAPETRLQLQLRGVVAVLPSGQGFAFIASDSGEERHYLPGAELPGGATLEQIREDRVILRREGRYEQLRLPRDAPLSAPGPSAPVEPVAAAQPGVGRGGTLPEDMRRQWLDNPSALFDTVQVQPVMRDGSISGFAIAPRRDARLFRELGLRPGDVVTAVNGIVVAGLTDPSMIRDQLQGASELRLEIERSGRPTTVVVPVGN